MPPPDAAETPDREAVRRSLHRLLAVHRVDDALAAVDQELAGLPGRREAAEAARAAAEAAEEAARAELARCQQAQKAHEDRSEAMGERILAIRQEQRTTKSNELYRQLDDEAERLKREREGGQVVTDILEAMEAVDEAAAALGRATARAREATARAEEEQRRLEAREAELRKERDRLAGERAVAADGLDAEDRARYERVVGRRPPGVVVVARELCTACRVQIPPQDYVDLISAARVVACGSCRRLLIHESLIEPGA